MDRLIDEYEMQLVEPECAPGSARYGAQVIVPVDISEAFPYLNAVMDNVWYDHEGGVLILREPDQAYAFRPHEIRLARVRDRLQAEELAGELVERVNHIWQERESITPRYTERRLPTVIDIFKLLPKVNCKECGYQTCLAFANDLRTGTCQLDQCPPMMKPEYAENRKKIQELFEAV
jgi:ArsR family metal-binding transcriptional regulator